MRIVPKIGKMTDQQLLDHLHQLHPASETKGLVETVPNMSDGVRASLRTYHSARHRRFAYRNHRHQ